MKRNLFTIAVAISICLFTFQASHAAITNVFFDATTGSILDPLVSGVSAFEFDILVTGTPATVPGYSMIFGPITATALTFTSPPNPAQVNNFGVAMSGGLLAEITYEDGLSIDLDSWVVTNPSDVILAQGIDYFVNFDGADYTVTAVPIPSAALLFGTGLLVLVGARRRMRS